MPDAHVDFPDAEVGATIFERREDLPADPAPGEYVVVDVMFFSTTVVELLARGADRVHVTDRRGEEFAYLDSHPEARIGGASTPEYEPAEGYDFFNSPSYVHSVDVDDRPVSMTSTNGGRAVAELRAAGDGVDVYVGTTTNARALAAHLDGASDTYLVCAGTEGDDAPEDRVGAHLVARHLAGDPPTATDRADYRTLLRNHKSREYDERHEVRRRDVFEYATSIDSRDVVPKLDGDCLVDVAGGDTERNG